MKAGARRRKVWDACQRLVLALLGTILAGASSQAQEQVFRGFGVPDGLTNLSVRCLLQDHTGYLWIGTDNGLFRFDGFRFREFGEADGLPSTEIRALAESRRTGEIWVATPGGLLHSKADHFVRDDAHFSANAGLIRSIGFDAAGDMYIAHPTGIFHRTSDWVGGYQFETVVSGETSGMLLEPDGILFGWRGELWRVRNGAVEAIGTRAGLPPDDWAAMLTDRSGNLWVRSVSRLWELPAGASRFVDRGQNIPHAQEPRIIADEHGQIFVATLAGLIGVDGTHRTLMDAEHGLDGQSVNTMLVDSDDVLWIGLAGGGLVRRMGHGEWLSWKRQDGLLHNSVWAIERDGTGNVWVGSSAGLNLLGADGKVRRSWTSKNGLPGDRVFAVRHAEGGDVFVGNDPEGLAQFSVDGRLLHVYGKKDGLRNRIMGLRLGPGGELWIAGDGGLVRSLQSVRDVSGETLRFKRFEFAGFPPDMRFYDIVFDNTRWAWVATSRGLLHTDGEHWRLFRRADGLPSNDVTTLAEHNGDLYLGYRNSPGMTRVQMEGEHLVATPVTLRPGTSSDSVYAIAFDHDGRLWATSDKGADVLDHGDWQHFSSENGLVWEDTDSRALTVDSTGDVWIGTSNGLSRYSRPQYVMAAHDHNVVITDVLTQNSSRTPDGELVLPYTDRAITIRVSTLDFSTPRVKFRYRLRGLQTEWTETRSHTVQFAALRGGDYTFEVIACDEYGRWNPQTATLHFRIQPPWWQTLWFYGLCALALLAAVRALLRLRVRKLIAQKEMLQRKVDEQTAELLESHRQLEAIAYFDLLTSLPNRRMFAEDFRKRIAAARRSGGAFSLLLLDLDLFKQVNDAYGHDAGDAVLVETAARLRQAVRETDCVARLGGDEFAILLDTADKPLVEEICARILQSCGEPIAFHRGRLRVGCSLGIAAYSADGETEDALYKSADVALYHTKRTRRNSYCWYGTIRPLVNEFANDAAGDLLPLSNMV